MHLERKLGRRGLYPTLRGFQVKDKLGSTSEYSLTVLLPSPPFLTQASHLPPNTLSTTSEIQSVHLCFDVG
jgi:hypothetical protein